MRRLTPILAVAAALAATPAAAHHSFSMFDRGRTQSVVGTVKSLELINPHGWLQLMAPDAEGRPREWSLEMGAPNQMQRLGWREGVLAAGDKVTAVIHPLKDGTNGGQLVSVTLTGGQTLNAGGPPGGRGAGGGQ